MEWTWTQPEDVATEQTRSLALGHQNTIRNDALRSFPPIFVSVIFKSPLKVIAFLEGHSSCWSLCHLSSHSVSRDTLIRKLSGFGLDGRGSILYQILPNVGPTESSVSAHRIAFLSGGIRLKSEGVYAFPSYAEVKMSGATSVSCFHWSA